MKQLNLYWIIKRLFPVPNLCSFHANGDMKQQRNFPVHICWISINLALFSGRFLNRCLSFCMLWVLTTYLFALSLRALLATDVMALFATNVACVYLLSWVILHEQFVGVRVSMKYLFWFNSICSITLLTRMRDGWARRIANLQIVAVILCDTGIALLAYMDGITGSPTLGGVVLAALAAAGYAVFKVKLDLSAWITKYIWLRYSL